MILRDLKQSVQDSNLHPTQGYATNYTNASKSLLPQFRLVYILTIETRLYIVAHLIWIYTHYSTLYGGERRTRT